MIQVRKLHRAAALFFSPFLITSAVTGLLWAYSPYLYLKQAPAPEKTTVRAAAVALLDENGNTIRTIPVEGGPKDVTVDEYGVQLKKMTKKYPAFHQWVMRIHRLEFFGTKKELVIFPGTGLLLMLATGLWLFKRGLK